jgi:hypothetical protein
MWELYMESPKTWAAPGAAPLVSAAPLYPALADPAARNGRGALALTRYWSVFGAAAAGWATFALAYCSWHLTPQSPQELGVVLFGAAAGGSGALAVLLHPEERS